jgi:hypothetical protein
VIRTDSDCINKPKGKTIIYKIHGDFKVRENIILTEDDYDRFFEGGRGKSLWSAVKDELLSHDVLFIGYSLGDNNVFSILKEINKDTRGKEHHYYLVVPEIKRSSRNKIEKEGVTYIQGKAEDILPKVIEVLDRKITRDFRKKDVFRDTYVKYCNLHGLNPVINPGVGEKPNDIERYNFLRPGKVEVSFATSLEKMNIIRDRNFSEFKDRLPLMLNQDGLPVLTIGRDELKELEIRINGLTVGEHEDIKSIAFMPVPREVDGVISIPSRNFVEKVKYRTYGDESILHIVLNTEIFNSQINIFTANWEGNFTYTLKDTYKNNSEAMKWVEFLIALCGGEEIYPFGPNSPFVVNRNEEEVRKLLRVREYYNYMHEIELRYMVSFDTYENFTPRNYNVSQLLAAAYGDGLIDISNQFYGEFEFPSSNTKEELSQKSLYKGSKLFLALTYNIEPYKLCGKTFSFKHRYVFMETVEVTDVVAMDNGDNKVQLAKKGNVYEILSDKEMNELVGKIKFNTISVTEDTKRQ